MAFSISLTYLPTYLQTNKQKQKRIKKNKSAVSFPPASLASGARREGYRASPGQPQVESRSTGDHPLGPWGKPCLP